MKKNLKIITYMAIIFLLLNCESTKKNYGKMAVTKALPFYESDDIYFPHDCFTQSVYMDDNNNSTLSIRQDNDCIKITNAFNDGLSGHEIVFVISNNLDIVSVTYNDWTDIINGSIDEYIVDKAILCIDSNPFKDSLITGFYTLQITETLFAENPLKKEGFNDTTISRIFNGKFKVYSEQERKNGKDWLINQNEIQQGIKDSLNIYYSPDKFATFSSGEDSLICLLRQFETERSETVSVKKKHITLTMIIDEKGNIIPESMDIREKMKSNRLLQELKNCDALFNWNPAIYKGQAVKSKVNLPIMIKSVKTTAPRPDSTGFGIKNEAIDL